MRFSLTHFKGEFRDYLFSECKIYFAFIFCIQKTKIHKAPMNSRCNEMFIAVNFDIKFYIKNRTHYLSFIT